MAKKELTTGSVKRKELSYDRKELIEGIFSGVRTPILALSLIHQGPPTIVDCNQAALDLIGYQRSEAADNGSDPGDVGESM